ncbi:MAG: glycosyltransferase family 4 protein [Coriobacteriia bacterium]|nr:glycosyltransferase family 4 protein [Coriobacteriia bacterium]MBN2823378.1 glycosyltransferase family 4 protein [Coriobacteriia bacterium]
MKILYIHQFFATRESSLGLIRSYEFARRWVDDGHQVTMITSSSRLPEEYSDSIFCRGEIDGIDIRTVRVRYSNYMSYSRRMLSFLQFTLGATWLAISAGKHDVVFATSTPLTVGIPGWIAAFVRNTPFVFEVRDLWPEAAIQMGAFSRTGVLGRSTKVLERFLYHRSREIIALSPGMTEGVIAENIEAAHVHTIPNCSDLDLFHPGPKDNELSAELGLEGRFVVGYAGAIGPTNAVEAIVPEAARLLMERGRDDIAFVIAGDGSHLPLLEDQIDKLGLNNVHLLGRVPKHVVPSITRSSDVLMTLFADVPVLAMNSPNKFFDGIASGRPMLVNSPGWTKDVVEQHEIGIYVPATDSMAMADAIMRLADDNELRERMGHNARRLAETEFGRDQLANRVLGVLEHAAHIS